MLLRGLCAISSGAVVNRAIVSVLRSVIYVDGHLHSFRWGDVVKIHLFIQITFLYVLMKLLSTQVCCLWKMTVWVLSFQFSWLVFLFLVLLHWISAPVWVETFVVDSHSEAERFQSFVIKHDISVGFFLSALYLKKEKGKERNSLSIYSLLYHEWVLTISNAYFVSIKNLM